MNKYKLQNTILFLFSIYMPLLFFEYYFSINNKALVPNHKAIKIENQKSRVSRVKSLIMNARLNNLQRNVYVSEIQMFAEPYKIFPIGTTPRKDIYYCDEGFGLVTFKSDRFGLRNKDQVWEKTNFKNKKQTVFIGDSYIQGACVETNQTITSVYKQYNNNNNVINLGSSGIGPLEYKALLRLMVKPIIKYSEKEVNVVLTFYANDRTRKRKLDFKNETLLENSRSVIRLVDNDNTKGLYPTTHYQQSISNIVKKHIDLEPSLSKKTISKYSFLERLKLKNIKFFVQNRLRASPQYIALLENNFSETLTYDALSELNKICINKCKPYVVFMPNSDFWRPNSTAHGYKRNIQQAAADLELPFWDATEVISQNSRSDYAPEGPHLSPKGYRKVSEGIHQFILKNK